jgi:hypothetical protein
LRAFPKWDFQVNADKTLPNSASLGGIRDVHPIDGTLRDLQTYFWLRVFSTPKQSPRPPTRRYPLAALGVLRERQSLGSKQ